jgi:hypothetical protein
MFFYAEQSRLKETVAFKEAHLLPFPVVSASIDYNDDRHAKPPDRPTIIARAHNSIDLALAEPIALESNETTHLIGSTYSDRNSY